MAILNSGLVEGWCAPSHSHRAILLLWAFSFSLGGKAKAGTACTLPRPFLSSTACACDPQGSISPGCDLYTGACLCREDILGPKCQACACGSRGGFPHCTTCPACFTSWDQHLVLLQLQLEAVAQEAAALYQGTPGWGVRDQGGRQQALEAVLQQAQTLLESPSPTVGILQQLTEWIAGLRQGAWGPQGKGLQLASQGQGFRGPQIGLSEF